MSELPSFSIVINTYNRSQHLRRTLQSFSYLNYAGQFEVVVVNGPSQDDTNEVIKEFGGRVRVGHCPGVNLSQSRNIGICLAAGTVIAFIDDDAIPEPDWLSHLAAAFSDPEVGAAGGFVFDHTGCSYQYRFCTVNRLGDAEHGDFPFESGCFPGSLRIPHLLGTNSAYRRTALVEVGGYDEEFEYFLDETDLQVRLVDAGYVIKQVPKAVVHHKYAASHLRTVERVVTNYFPSVKNKVYFSIKHGSGVYANSEIVRAGQQLVKRCKRGVFSDYRRGKISWTECRRLRRQISKAAYIGWERGMEGPRADGLITKRKQLRWQSTFNRFASPRHKAMKTIVLVTKDFPPGHNGGIASYNKDLADSLAERGHCVHVIAQSKDTERVDWENGVWIHRLATSRHERSVAARNLGVPQHIWDWSVSALQVVRELRDRQTIDVVEAPIWDCEGIAFLVDGTFPLVTSLQTTRKFWLESHPEYGSNEEWMESLGRPILRLERLLMEESCCIRSISAAIKKDIETAYGMRLPADRTVVSHLGLKDSAGGAAKDNDSREGDDACEILFVGRLEHRKGIDVLLNVVPDLLAQYKKLMVRIIGDDTLRPGNSDKTYREAFEKRYAREDWLSRVMFEGKVSASRLNDAYANCDIFVAPSRFESFGLIFLEAMRAGKPVIGCNVGGIPEIVKDRRNGFLVAPGSSESLSTSVKVLIESRTLRKRFGENGRQMFVANFTADRMAAASEGLYDLAINVAASKEAALMKAG